jgi:transposase
VRNRELARLLLDWAVVARELEIAAHSGPAEQHTRRVAERVCFLPAYAPHLNPVEGIWSLLRSSQANTAFTDPNHLMRTLRQGLRQIQYRSNVIDGCLAETGLTLTASHQGSQ